jgi:hypothetical protein
MGCVGEVEHLNAELYVQPLFDSKIPKQTKVPVEDTKTRQDIEAGTATRCPAVAGIIGVASYPQGRRIDTGNPQWYPWVSEHLLRFGTERETPELLNDFLGRPVSPEALLDDIRRLSPGVPDKANIKKTTPSRKNIGRDLVPAQNKTPRTRMSRGTLG